MRNITKNPEQHDFEATSLLQTLRTRHSALGTLSFPRGNTLVLVAGILVLLVIIATAYVTRTQAGRITAVAVQHSDKRDDNAKVVANMIADEISQALFVWPVDPVTFPVAPFTVNSNALRLTPTDQSFGNPVRYGVDFQLGHQYNFAPYAVVPWTNWPDADPVAPIFDALWPFGPANTTGSALIPEGNPPGNPGFGDSRWLRDFEPLRWETGQPNPPGFTGVNDAFLHWRHLTNLSRPNNAWRIVKDVSDVTGGLITDLGIPIEQWLALPPRSPGFATLNPLTGNAVILPTVFMDQWSNWFELNAAANPDFFGYSGAYDQGSNFQLSTIGIPQNYYRLSDLNANGVPHQIGERPEDEFIPDSMRWQVSRVLADTDGDGFTDAFWHLVPTPTDRGLRQIVAVSIIDNSAMFPVNVATRFGRNDGPTVPILTGSRGHTPADLSLIGQNADDLSLGIMNTYNVGFYDSPEQHNQNTILLGGAVFDYLPGNSSRWWRHVRETGMPTFSTNPNPQNETNQLNLTPKWFQRLDYFRNSSLSLLNPTYGSFYTPFSLDDELELRMYAGNNYPFAFSRYEWSVQGDNTNGLEAFLRAGTFNPESTEFQNQLINKAAVRDSRHRLTMYSGARNDIMPPWLWLFASPFDDNDNDGDGFPNVLPSDANDRFLYEIGKQKFDLREPDFRQDMNNDGVINSLDERYYRDYDNDSFIDVDDELEFRMRLQALLTGGLLFEFLAIPANNESYFGTGAAKADITKRAAASLTANILAWRDRDDDPLPVDQAVAVDLGGGNVKTYIGLEPQPFFMEAFIAHVYKPFTIPANNSVTGDLYNDAGKRVVVHLEDCDTKRASVIVVQLANPFDEAIDLWKFQVKLFGQELDLQTLLDLNGDGIKDLNEDRWLAPAYPREVGTTFETAFGDIIRTEPNTLILYAIGDINGTPANEFEEKWLDFLDIQNAGDPLNVPPNERQDLPVASIRVNVNLGSDIWSTNREEYDSSTDPALELVMKVFDSNGTTTTDIVVDRIDPDGSTDRKFGDAVSITLNSKKPEEILGVGGCDIGVSAEDAPQGGNFTFGMRYVPATFPPDTLWVQYARVTRAWGVDVDEDGYYEPNEHNPRYVFSQRMVTMAAPIEDPILAGGGLPSGFDNYTGVTPLDPFNLSGATDGHFIKFGEDPDGRVTPNTNNDLPWFGRDYRPFDSVNPTLIRFHKPTFFNFNPDNDGDATTGYPDDDGNLATFIPDKGWYGQDETDTGDPIVGPFDAGMLDEDIRIEPMQMLLKNDDFEQIGELNNVFLWGHELLAPGGVYSKTELTFSEIMAGKGDPDMVNPIFDGIHIGRLNPMRENSMINGDDATPALPAAVRLFDAFVCDNVGSNPINNDLDGDGDADQFDLEILRFGNAHYFSGRMTPGMININTAPPEVIHPAPHMTRVVNEYGLFVDNPINRVPEAIVQYRERLGNQYDDADFRPGYESRGTPGLITPDPIFDNMRGERGMVSVGELQLLRRAGKFGKIGNIAAETINYNGPFNTNDQIAHDNIVDNNAYRIDQPAMSERDVYDADTDIDASLPDLITFSEDVFPFYFQFQTDTSIPLKRSAANTRLGTDRISRRGIFNGNEIDWQQAVDENARAAFEAPFVDDTAEDAEEANLLFSGMSNLITTRSDVFTVYFKIRTFAQNPVTGRWDALDKEFIEDTSRYVMLVDRSEVNHPNDKPKILYLEKLPN